MVRVTVKMALYALLAVSLLAVALFFTAVGEHKQAEDAQNNLEENNFGLLDESIADLSVEEFMEKQKSYIGSYSQLRLRIVALLEGANGSYGIYMEDLVSGAWTGINEREGFVPASLAKVPLSMAIMKKIENGDMSLDQKIETIDSDLDPRYSEIAQNGSGQVYTVKELLTLMLRRSDNTAQAALYRQLSPEEMEEASIAVGIRSISKPEEDVKITPKQYSNIFRSLYFSSYLKRPSSQYLLSVMTNTKFRGVLQAGVPEGVKVAHKIGVWNNEKSYHDCGIVYYPDNPYFLCVMTKNSNPERAEERIISISREAYNFIDASHKED